MLWRFATGLRRFVRSTLTPQDCFRIVHESVRQRESRFLSLVRRGVYGYAESPYLKLLQFAGVEYGDIERMVRQDGIEATMDRLYDAGVRVDLEEMKGLRPIDRRGLYIPTAAEDFDNPLLLREFEVESGGSTGRRRRMSIDFQLLTYDAACKYVFHEAHGLEKIPFAIWRAVPPGSAGLKNALFAVKLGHPLAKWFTPTKSSWKPETFKSASFKALAVYGSRLWGAQIPTPEHVRLDEGKRVARWLAEQTEERRPVLLGAPASGAARVAAAAMDENLDISSTVFRVGGEPLTEAKFAVIRQVGGQTVSGWAMSETGPLAGGCARREVTDEVHLFRGKIAVLQHRKLLSDGETSVDALHLTTLHPATPKILLNVDTGDFGVLSERSCGCPLENVGFNQHLHTIRSYEKLTAGGMHFMGLEIERLVEEVLPSTRGGGPTDYQMVEEEVGTATRVSVIVSPRLGNVDENAVVRTVLNHLGGHSRGHHMMAVHWDQGEALRVLRCEPHATAVAKIPAMLVLSKS